MEASYAVARDLGCRIGEPQTGKMGGPKAPILRRPSMGRHSAI